MVFSSSDVDVKAWTIRRLSAEIDAFKQIQCMKLKTLWLGTKKDAAHEIIQPNLRWSQLILSKQRGERRRKRTGP